VKPTPPPKPAAKRLSWRATLVIAFFVWAIGLFIGSILIVGDEGFAVVVSTAYWEVAGVFGVIALAVACLFRFAVVTRADVTNKVDARREARRGHPRDLTLLGIATQAERARWFRIAGRAARRLSIWRVVASVPASVVLAYIVWKENAVFPDIVAYVWMAFTIVAIWLLVAFSLRALRGTPLLLVGTVSGGIYGEVIKGGEVPGLEDLLVEWFEYGSWRTVTVDVTAASCLHRDGSLTAEPRWHGERKIGARRAVHRRLIEGEHCVLLCAGMGTALYQLGQLANSPAKHSSGVSPASTLPPGNSQ